MWTAAVAQGTWSGWDLPGVGPPAPARAEPRPTFPLRAAALAFAGVLSGIIASFLFGVASWALTHSPTVTLVAGQAGLWAGLLGACALASRRFGTGDVAADLGFRFRWADAGTGMAWSLLGRLVLVLVVIPVVQVSQRLAGSNDEVFTAVEENSAARLALFVIAVIGAPLIEELFFRGLLLRALDSRLAPRTAVAVQGLAFGLVHVSPFRGLGNASVFVGLSAFGMFQGCLARRYGRLGPAVATHAWFNATSTAFSLL